MPDLDHLSAEELRGGFLAAALSCANLENLGKPCELYDLKELLCSGLELLRRRDPAARRSLVDQLLKAERVKKEADPNVYRESLRKILAWVAANSYTGWNLAGDSEVIIDCAPGEALIDALSNAGFEIDHDGVLVVDGVREKEAAGE